MEKIIKVGQTYTVGNFNLKVMYVNGRHLYVEKTGVFKIEPIKFLQLASIINGNIVLNLGNEDEQHKYSVEKFKSIVDEWAKADEDKVRAEVVEAERKKELARLESVRNQKFLDAREQRKSDVIEVKNLITEAKDFKAIRKNSRISELLSEIAEIDIMLTLI